MTLLLSWSKPQSKIVATTLRAWLPVVIPGIEPWISTNDIDKGREWYQELRNVLATAKGCLICITEENVRSPWIYYEVGAISTNGPDVSIYPYLVGANPNILSAGPFSRWQFIEANREETWDLVRSLNSDALSHAHDEGVLSDRFDANWASLEAALHNLPSPRRVDDGIEPPTESIAGVALSDEAQVLLIQGSQDRNGTILFSKTFSGTEISTNDVQLIPEQTPRVVAKWMSAIEQLLHARLVEQRGPKGQIFAVTHKGFSVADALRDGCST